MSSAEHEPNALISEASPYLRQHSLDLVRWLPWGEEALRRAREEDKPIFLSIGYSSCHWCHVMQEESFNNPEIAAILNRHFIPVLVDREERPELDELYMAAVQLMTGQGGWPLTVLLTPELEPFFGGTYFPPEPRQGLPSLKQVLLAVLEVWRNKRAQLKESAKELLAGIRQLYSTSPAELEQGPEVVRSALDELVMLFDEKNGGFGDAPKFPMPGHLLFLLRIHGLTKEPIALRMAHKTLLSMARGGIHDQLAGGFHRYSTDRAWLLPHFEKMLADNALLARAYLEGYQLTSDEALRDVAERTLGWALREMRVEGAFASALDADSEGEEGKYYLWSSSEVERELGQELARVARSAFGITTSGNVGNGLNVLYLATAPEQLAQQLGMSVEQAYVAMEEARERLLSARERRPRPFRDDKVVAAYNGLMISALAYAYQVLGKERYREAAEQAARYVLSKLWKGGQLHRCYAAGRATGFGVLEDYAFLTRGLIDLYEATLEETWLDSAIELHQSAVQLFHDEQGGGFFYAQRRANLPLPGLKSAYDGALPSGNSYALGNALYLAELLGDQAQREVARRTARAFWGQVRARPSSFTFLLCSLLLELYPAQQVVLAAGSHDEARELLREVHRAYLPNRVLAATWLKGSPVAKSPLVRDKMPIQGRPTAYVCSNYACREPSLEPEHLRRMLAEAAGARGHP